MARSLRQDPPGGIHHVYHRALEPHDCFMDDRDRSVFLRLLAESCDAVDANVLAYCLMGNHFHLVLKLPRSGLADAMKPLIQEYTSLFNVFHDRSGSLFRGRYASKLVDSDNYLAVLSRYIHRNPLEMTYRIHPYRWSSYAAYIGASRPEPWLKPGVVLSVGSGSQGYRRFVETDVESDKVPMAAGIRSIGAQPAVGRVFRSLGGVDAAIQQATGTDPTDSRAHGRRPNVPRLLAVLTAVEAGVVDSTQIADHYGYRSLSSLRSAVATARRLVASDSALVAIYNSVRYQMDGV